MSSKTQNDSVKMSEKEFNTYLDDIVCKKENRKKRTKIQVAYDSEKDFRKTKKSLLDRKKEKANKKAAEPTPKYSEIKKRRKKKHDELYPFQFAKLDMEEHYQGHLKQQKKELQTLIEKLSEVTKDDKLLPFEKENKKKVYQTEIQKKKQYIYLFGMNCDNLIFTMSSSIMRASLVDEEELGTLYDEKILQERNENPNQQTNIFNFFTRSKETHKERIQYVYNKFYYDQILNVCSNVSIPKYEQMLELDKEMHDEKMQKGEREKLSTRKKKNLIHAVPEKSCQSCGSKNIVIDKSNGHSVCKKCSVVSCGNESLTVGYKHKQDLIMPSPGYQRLGHFISNLEKLEGSEKTYIPPIVIEKLRKKYKEIRIDPEKQPEKIKPANVRAMLSQINFSRYLSNTTRIINILTKRKALCFTTEQKDKLCILFNQLQAPFNNNKRERTNFPSYSYILYKLCQLLGYDEFLERLKLLQYNKLKDLDIIWKDMCEEARFEYIATTSF